MCFSRPVPFGAGRDGAGQGPWEGEGGGSDGGEGAEGGAGETRRAELPEDLVLERRKVGYWTRAIQHQSQLILVP